MISCLPKRFYAGRPENELTRSLVSSRLDDSCGVIYPPDPVEQSRVRPQALGPHIRG